jgi:hypothetical protein
MNGNRAAPRARRIVRRGLLTACVALIAAFAVTACGSSSSKSSSSGGSGGSATSASSASSGGGGSTSNAAAVSAAKAFVAKWSQRPTSLTVPALPSKPKPGGTVDYIECGVPSCQAFAPILKTAAASVGWTIKVIGSGVTPQSEAAAYSTAVRDKPNGVIGSGGVDPHLFSQQIGQLHAEGVPVLQQVIPPTDVQGVTAIAYGAPYMKFDGLELGNEIMADSGGKNVHIVYMGTPAIPIYLNTRAGVESVLNKQGACQGCTSDTFSFPETDIGTTLPSVVVSYLRSHPDINYIDFDFADLADGVPTALAGAGLSSKVKIVANGVAPIQIQYLKNDQMLAAAGNPWPEILYYEMNIIYADSEKASTTAAINVQLPAMLQLKTNLFPVSSSSPYFPLVANYQSVFAKAWHTS